MGQCHMGDLQKAVGVRARAGRPGSGSIPVFSTVWPLMSPFLSRGLSFLLCQSVYNSFYPVCLTVNIWKPKHLINTENTSSLVIPTGHYHVGSSVHRATPSPPHYFHHGHLGGRCSFFWPFPQCSWLGGEEVGCPSGPHAGARWGTLFPRPGNHSGSAICHPQMSL